MSTCASAATWRRTPRAKSPIATSWWPRCGRHSGADVSRSTPPAAWRRRFTFYGPTVSASVNHRLGELAARYELASHATDRLTTLLDLVAAEPASITSVRDPREGVDVHIADSLVALELDVVRSARRIADLGSGAGFPGLVLAVALPHTKVALVESVARKAAFLDRAVRTLDLDNAAVIPARAESWRGGLGIHDLVTARALALLGVVLEYAAPLLALGGAMVGWKGRPDAREVADGTAAAEAL